MSASKSCPECHHVPSGRIADHGAACWCKCHDIADAAPGLLAELEETAAWLDERAAILENCGDKRRKAQQLLGVEAARFRGRAAVIRQTILATEPGGRRGKGGKP